jgi:hypothetical protein
MRCRPVLAVLLASALGTGCGQSGEEVSSQARALIDHATRSPNARPGVVEEMAVGLAAPRHPSDGGGSAVLVGESSTPATAGHAGRWVVDYTAGPLGVAVGGRILFQVSPFWGWSTPQPDEPLATGYTVVTTDADGVELSAFTAGAQLLVAEIDGRPLAAGETVRFDYGAGPAGAVADRYAESASVFWIGVDGDGDGVRALIDDPPRVPVGPGPAARLLATLPSTARPGDTLRLVVAVVDALGNAGPPWAGDVTLEGGTAGLETPDVLSFDASDLGRRTVRVVARDAGLYRLTLRAPGLPDAETNPLVVAETGPRVLWADLQIHTGLSDGTGSPADAYVYARDVAGLDVAAVTDHDHWGMVPLDDAPATWEEIRREAERHHVPGSFVTILGYEWTSWIHGHRHVLYFDGEGDVLSSMDPRYDTPQELWAALEGRAALTLTHHTAGAPIAADWEVAPDPTLEPLTEVCSVHGSSEAADAPNRVGGFIPGNSARDALDRGYRLGFVGSTDGHDGHPGLAHLAAPSGGIAAVLSESLTRDGVLEALRARRCYATNGPRILLRFAVGGVGMGGALDSRALEAGGTEVYALTVAPAPIDHIDLIRSGRVEGVWAGEGVREVELLARVEALEAGEYLYLRVVQEDGGAAWSSPVWVD